MYPEGYLGYGADTGVLVLLDDSTITPKIMGTKGRVPQYSCSMIQLYICMYLYIGYMTHINVKGEITIRIDACSCKLQLYIFGELAEVKNDEPQLE